MAKGTGNLYWVRNVALDKEMPLPSSSPRPLIVAFGWMGCQRRHLDAYCKLFDSCGWDTLACRPATLNLWFPSHALAFARQVVACLAAEVRGALRPVVFFMFSGAGKAVYYKVLQLLEGRLPDDSNIGSGSNEEADHGSGSKPPPPYADIARCVVGQAYDSGPQEFESAVGVRFLASAGPAARRSRSVRALQGALARAAAVALDATFLSEFERQRADFWRTLETTQVRGEVLLLHSQDDEISPLAHIEGFAARLKAQGRVVVAQKWASSPHVGHLRQHRDEYVATVSAFLRRAEGLWQQLQVADASVQQPVHRDDAQLTPALQGRENLDQAASKTNPPATDNSSSGRTVREAPQGSETLVGSAQGPSPRLVSPASFGDALQELSISSGPQQHALHLRSKL